MFTLPVTSEPVTFASDSSGGLYAAIGLPSIGGLGYVTAYAPAGAAWTPPANDVVVGAANPTVFSDGTFRSHVIHTPRGIWDRLRYRISISGGPALPVGNDVMVSVGMLAAIADVNGDPQVLTTDAPGGTFLRSPGGVWTQTAIPAANRFSGATSLVMNSAGRTMLVYENGSLMRLESILVGGDGALGTAEPIAPIGAGALARVLAPDAGTFAVVFSDATGGLRAATKTGAAAWSVTTLGTAPLACRTCAGTDGLGRVHALARANGVLAYVHTDGNNQPQSEPADFGSVGGGAGPFGLEVDPMGTLNVLVSRTDSAATPPSTTFHHVYRCPAANAGNIPAAAGPNAGYWQGMGSPALPEARHIGQGMAFDASQHEMVLFGGRNFSVAFPGSVESDTWTYPTGGSSWTKKALSTGTNPGSRIGHGMAFDPVRARVVLMGGGFTPDVWEWNGASATWSQRTGLSVPAALIDAGQSQTRLAYDSGRAKFVVLQTGSTGGLWDWDPVTGVFTPRTPAGQLPAAVASIVYDAPSGLIIGFGAGSITEWAPATGVWTARSVTGTAPLSGEIVATGGGRYVVYDGQTTWELSRSSTAWARRTHARTPPAVRADPLVAFHPERGAAWMFGGNSNVGVFYVVHPNGNTSSAPFPLRDTLEWHGATAAP